MTDTAPDGPPKPEPTILPPSYTAADPGRFERSSFARYIERVRDQEHHEWHPDSRHMIEHNEKNMRWGDPQPRGRTE